MTIDVFKNDHLSVSRLKLYETCPRAFYFAYVNKGEREPTGEPAVFGVVLHASLEMIYTWIMREEYTGLFPESQLIAYYREAWQASTLTNVQTWQEGLTILRRYAQSHSPVDHFDLLDSEKEFNINVDGFVLNGFIDLIKKVGDEHIEIVDFKSNRMLYTRDELETDLQLSIYGVVVRQLYPWAKKISFSFELLRYDLAQRTERTAQVLDDAAGYVVALGRRTETDTTWEAKLNSNCGWCDHRRRCEAYAKALETGADITKVKDLTNLEAMLRERDRVAKFAKLAYARQKEIDTLLKVKIAQEGEFDAADWHCRLIPMFETTYGREQVVEAFAHVGVKPEVVLARILTLDSKAVTELAEEISVTPEQRILLTSTLKALAKQTPGTSKIDVRAKKRAKKV
jgi:RecB family exonuclease